MPAHHPNSRSLNPSKVDPDETLTTSLARAVPGRHQRPSTTRARSYGTMLWLRWKTLSGSYRRFTSRSRSRFGPYAARTASSAWSSPR